MSERERTLANGGDVQCLKCFAIGDGRSFSPPYEVCDSCAQLSDALHEYVPDPAGDEDYCAHIGDEGRCGWARADHEGGGQ